MQWRQFGAAGVLAFLALVCSGPAYAQAVSTRGFAEGRGLFYPQKTDADSVRSIGEARARLEAFWHAAGWVTFAGAVDARMDTHDQVDRSWRLDLDDRSTRWPALALRRASISLHGGPLSVDLGKQFIRWGKADILNPVDRFAPRDFLNVFDDEFLAVTGARAVYLRSSETVDVVWVPQFTPSRIPLFGQRWGVPNVPGLAEFVDAGARYPGGDQFGARWSHTGARFELAGTWYRGFNHLPQISASGVVGHPVRLKALRTYPEMKMGGVDAAVPLKWLTLKGEIGYFTTTTPLTDEYGLYVIQAERQTGEWSFVGGYAGEFVTRKVSQLSFAPDRGLSKSVVARAGYTIDVNRSASIETVIQRHASMLKGEYSQAVGQHWRATLAGVWLRGSDNSFLGLYNRNSHVRVGLRFSF